ncbi:MAG: putative secreted peptidase [Verrucomicrobia bacterium]|nr:putative secreted peptidase [Verrucomicrobiota bacterium]
MDRLRQLKFVAVGTLVTCFAELVLASPTDVGPELPAKVEESLAPIERDAARLTTETPRISSVRLSPDGHSVLYILARASVADNSWNTELFLQRVPSNGQPPEAPVEIAHCSHDYIADFAAQWRPDGRAFTYFSEPFNARAWSGAASLMEYEVTSRGTRPLPLRNLPRETRPPITAFGSDYRWSPHGNFIAFTAATGEESAKLDPRRGIAVSVNWNTASGTNNVLFVVEVASGRIEQLSTDALNVLQFDWSPDENELVIAAAPDTQGVPDLRTDLFVIDRVSHGLRALVVQPGVDAGPTWSPDGQWIAFTSQFGAPSFYGGTAAVVAAGGGPVVRLGDDDGPRLYQFGTEFFWTADSRSFFFTGRRRMTMLAMRAQVAKRDIAPLWPDLDERIWVDNLSANHGATVVAFTHETKTQPPELFVRATNGDAVVQLTRLASDFPFARKVRIDLIEWPSRDAKFSIHGVLLTPTAAWENSNRPKSRLPTLIYLVGGPGMVPLRFNETTYSQMLHLAARGYAVLAPNTRGRAGYGMAFMRGMRDGPSAAELPYQDAMAGVDFLIARGVADSDRLGIYGHSYGAYLTSYAIEQTRRFKAAFVDESHLVDLLSDWMVYSSSPDFGILGRDLYGARDLFEPKEQARLLAESPGLHTDRVRTPVLLSFGAKSGAARIGRPLFNTLQRFHVPSEFLLYDEGHNYVRPAAIADNLSRMADWLDFWVRGRKDPTFEKQSQYDRWDRMKSGFDATPTP